MTETTKKAHAFTFNPEANGGEALMLCTQAIKEGDKPVCFEQELTLCSYCNNASFQLAGATFTPELLRQLADELEEFFDSVEE